MRGGDEQPLCHPGGRYLDRLRATKAGMLPVKQGDLDVHALFLHLVRLFQPGPTLDEKMLQRYVGTRTGEHTPDYLLV